MSCSIMVVWKYQIPKINYKYMTAHRRLQNLTEKSKKNEGEKIWP
jgi:hypothetical protein